MASSSINFSGITETDLIQYSPVKLGTGVNSYRVPTAATDIVVGFTELDYKTNDVIGILTPGQVIYVIVAAALSKNAPLCLDGSTFTQLNTATINFGGSVNTQFFGYLLDASTGAGDKVRMLYSPFFAKV